jgi:hypothetical protein
MAEAVLEITNLTKPVACPYCAGNLTRALDLTPGKDLKSKLGFCSNCTNLIKYEPGIGISAVDADEIAELDFIALQHARKAMEMLKKLQEAVNQTQDEKPTPASGLADRLRAAANKQ